MPFNLQINLSRNQTNVPTDKSDETDQEAENAERQADDTLGEAGETVAFTEQEQPVQPTTSRESSPQTPEEYPLTEQFQPDPKLIEVQKLGNKTLRFQERWFKSFPWLHYSSKLKGVVCFYCINAFSKQTPTLAKNTEQTFISTGFRNWKRGKEAFVKHTNSKAHNIAVNTFMHSERPIKMQLCTISTTAQEEARLNLSKIVNAVKYLTQQGLPLRGHSQEEGNFHQLLLFMTESDPTLASWLKRNHCYMSPAIQNEIMNLMSNNIIREIAQEITALPMVQYSIIMDGTQSISGVERVSICLRYVDTDLEPREEFVGLYEASSTTGEQIGKIAHDVLLRLNLPLSSLRGQTYDGAANMSGHLSGVQAYIRKEQPLATFVHCGPDCVNLVAQAACSATPIIRNSLQWIHKLGCLFGQSGKFKTIFKSVAKSTSGCYTTLKPLCPTRWTVCTPAINSVLTQYEAVLTALEEMALSSTHDTASRANGLRERFLKGNTVLGLLLAQDIMIGLEELNTSLQGRGATVGGMLSAVECVKNSFLHKRTEECFVKFYRQASEVIASLDLELITLPHLRMPTMKHAGPAQSYIPSTAEEYYRVKFFEVLDTVTTQLTNRFGQKGLCNLVRLENVLISGQVDNIVEQYPELESRSLKVQMAMFQTNYNYQNCKEVVDILKNMVPEVRGLFNQVETLVRLLLVVPASSAEAERSFSALRRLKTWLRSTMSQNRLNSVAVCHVHKDRTNKLDKQKICQEFRKGSERRVLVFGSF